MVCFGVHYNVSYHATNYIALHQHDLTLILHESIQYYSRSCPTILRIGRDQPHSIWKGMTCLSSHCMHDQHVTNSCFFSRKGSGYPHAILYYGILHCNMPYYVAITDTIGSKWPAALFCSGEGMDIPYYSLLWYTVVWHAILCCTVPSYTLYSIAALPLCNIMYDTTQLDLC